MMVSEFRSSLPQILAVSIKNIILIAFGMTLGFPTVLIPALQGNQNNEESDEFFLNKSQISWISSINLICVPMGCVFSGTFTAVLGRRKAMQLVCLPIVGAWITFFLSHQVYHLYIALCLSGFAGGMLEAPVLTYVAEISTPKLRGILAATGSFCIILGIFSQFLMGIFLQWRTITLVSIIIPVLAILLLFFVPESPHWLILKNRDEEAKKSLMWLRGWHKTFDGVKQEFDELHKSLTAPESSTGQEKDESALKAFKRRTFILPYFICSLAFLIGHFSGMTTLQTYAVPIFAQLKAPVDKYFATMLLGIVELIGTCLCVMLVRFVGKRKLTFVSLIGCSFCFFSTALYAIFIDKISGENPRNDIIANVSLQMADTMNATSSTFAMTTDAGVSITKEYVNNSQDVSVAVNETASTVATLVPSEYSWIPLTLLLSSALLSHSGIRLLPWMLIGEVFPTRIRGISSGLTGGTSYIFGFLANKLFLTMISSLTLPGTFLLYSIVSAGGCIILFVLLPETEGRTLQEIENHFSGKRKLPKSLKHKEPVSDDPFPTKFDITHWESNEKFERYVKNHQINVNHHHHPHHPSHDHSLGNKRKIDSNAKLPANRSTTLVNDNDYDTPL